MLIRQKFITEHPIPVSGLVKLVASAIGVESKVRETKCEGQFPEQRGRIWPYVIVSAGSSKDFAVAYDPGNSREYSLAANKSSCFIVVADESELTPEITAKLLPEVAKYARPPKEIRPVGELAQQ